MVLVQITPSPYANSVNGVNGANGLNGISVLSVLTGIEGIDDVKPAVESAALHRDLNREFLTVARAEGNYLVLDDGRRIFDASGGPSVGCIGWGNIRVANAMIKQILAVPYSGSVFYTTKAHEDLCRDLVDSTGGEMSRAYIVNSGS